MASDSGHPAPDRSQIPRVIYDAFRRGQVEEILAQLDPAVEWRLAEGHPYSPAGEAWVGHAEVVDRFFARAGAEWDEFAVALTGYHEVGDTVVVEVRYSGTCKATGRELDAQGCHLWKLRNGKVAAFQQYVDTSQLRTVMGTIG